uniref:Uncharacterized protein n=1 Tax=Pseudodiaptomus poplesia TaxID=213370 RepID=A0A0U2T7W6_9MAXI|nr:hypothetical protein [Pseudodiaptomus poplesia]ALS04720.1 hypothetical protein [Pseudodiaptomus poplesia]
MFKEILFLSILGLGLINSRQTQSKEINFSTSL